MKEVGSTSCEENTLSCQRDPDHPNLSLRKPVSGGNWFEPSELTWPNNNSDFESTNDNGKIEIGSEANVRPIVNTE